MLSSILAWLPVCLVIYDDTGTPMFANERFRSLTGLGDQELTTTAIQHLVHPNDLETVLGHWRAAVVGEQVPPARYRMIRADGETVWFLGHTSAIYDADQSVVAYIGCSLDLTPTVSIEEALRAAVDYTNAIIDHSSDIITIMDADATWRSSSRAATTLLGYPAGYDPPEGIISVVHPDDRDRAERAFAETVAGTREATDLVELRIRDIHGSYRTFEVAAVNLVDDPAVHGVLLNARDITARKATEQALTASEERFSELVARMQEGVWNISHSGRLSFANARAAEMLGRPLEELCTAWFPDLIHPHDLDSAMAMYERHRSGLNDVREIRFLHADGSIVWTLVAGSPFYADGVVAGASAVITDISAMKATEQALQAALREAEEAATAKNQFLSQVSHELRTPLNGVLGYAEILEEVLEEPGKQYTALISRSGKHLLRLIDDLLDLGRAEAGTFEVAVRPVHLRDAVHQALAIVDSATPRDPHSPAARVGFGTDHYVLADEDRLVQVIVNLVSNAFRHGKGKVQVDAALHERHGRFVVRCQVHDEGEGIRAADHKRVFEPFVQGTPTQDGYGIGLAVTRALVEAMSGVIDFETGPAGTLVWFELPACDPPETVSPAFIESTPLQALEPTPRRRPSQPEESLVLCVEDDPVNQDLLRHALARLDCQTEFVSTLAAAHEFTAQHDPDVVLLDVFLPDGSGIEAIPRLAAGPRGARPVLMVTATANRTLLEEAADKGAAEVILKPFRLRWLTTKVESYLPHA